MNAAFRENRKEKISPLYTHNDNQFDTPSFFLSPFYELFLPQFSVPFQDIPFLSMCGEEKEYSGKVNNFSSSSSLTGSGMYRFFCRENNKKGGGGEDVRIRKMC